MARKSTATKPTSVTIEGTATDVTDTALSTGTVMVPVPVPPIAGMGDNAPPPDADLPDLDDLRDRFSKTMHAWVDAETAVEFARQRAAFLVISRHDRLGPDAGITWDGMQTALYARVTRNNSAALDELLKRREAYMETLLTEAAGPYKAWDDCHTDADRDAFGYRARVSTFIKRTVELAANLVCSQRTRADFDAERGQWRVPPMAFVPPGHIGSPMLLLELDPAKPDQVTPRQFVYLESNVTRANFHVSRADTPAKLQPIRLSLDQFNTAQQSHWLVRSKPDTQTSDIPSTAAEARKARAPQQPVATDAAKPATDTSTPVAPVVAPDADAGPAGAKGTVDRSFYVAQINTHLTALCQLAAVDVVTPMSRSDFSEKAWEGLSHFVVFYDRIQEGDMAAITADTGIVRPTANAPRKARK
jgi:hypothetical protein